LLALLTGVLFSLIFAPIGIWPVSFFCLVPWLVMVGGSRHARRVYVYSFLMGWAFFLVNMRWMYPATGLGYVALALYLAWYFPLMACPIRHVARRRRWPLAVVVPVVWVGGEMLRAVLLSGFPWFYLAHGAAPVLTLIQVSDLVGAYGLSFVIAACNGALADLLLARMAVREGGPDEIVRRPTRLGVAWSVALLLGTCAYGWFRLGQDTMSEGPRVAVLQGDFVNSVTERGEPEDVKMRIYLEMLEAASAEKPDLYLLPESPWFMYLNTEFRANPVGWMAELSQMSFDTLRTHAVRHGAYLVTGSASLIETPNSLFAKEERYNSAMVFSPDGSDPLRYDKVHVVPFGETVPFRFGRFRFLYFWLNRLTPFSGPDGTDEFSIFPGQAFKRFTMTSRARGGASFAFGIPICYEDVMPYVSRRFVSGGAPTKQVDMLLNISNDGWFGRGVQQPQHLAVCVFRAVENRVGIARAVNTGVSAFIDPTGAIHDRVSGDPAGRWPGKIGYAVASVGVDSRYTFYSRHGDWFAWTCAGLWLMLFVDYFIARMRGHD
jgi:apolipoprotein N-acyltransferase